MPKSIKKYEKPEFDGKFELNGKVYFYRASDDPNGSKILKVKHTEKYYRMVYIYESESAAPFPVQVYCGEDSFTLFPETVKQQYEEVLKEKEI